MHGGRSAKGFRTEMINSCVSHMFCHSPESWTDLWDGEIFRKGSVEVEVKLLEREPRKFDPPGIIMYWLVWSIIRR